jgi:hypothetical protein
LHASTIYYWCDDLLKLNTRVAWVSLPLMRIRMGEALKSKIQRFPATLHNTGWMHHWPVRHGCFEAIAIFDPVDVDEANSHIASPYHSLDWHVQSYCWR